MGCGATAADRVEQLDEPLEKVHVESCGLPPVSRPLGGALASSAGHERERQEQAAVRDSASAQAAVRDSASGQAGEWQFEGDSLDEWYGFRPELGNMLTKAYYANERIVGFSIKTQFYEVDFTTCIQTDRFSGRQRKIRWAPCIVLTLTPSVDEGAGCAKTPIPQVTQSTRGRDTVYQWQLKNGAWVEYEEEEQLRFLKAWMSGTDVVRYRLFDFDYEINFHPPMFQTNLTTGQVRLVRVVTAATWNYGGKNTPETQAWQLTVGTLVVASRDFRTDSSSPVLVRKGVSGIVDHVYKDGDLCVLFECHDTGQWVCERNFKYLDVVTPAAAAPDVVGPTSRQTSSHMNLGAHGSAPAPRSVGAGMPASRCVASGKSRFSLHPDGHAAEDGTPSAPSAPAGADSGRPMQNERSRSPPPAKSATPPLPRGWVEYSDPASGAAYYHNASTGETSWDRPHDYPSSSPLAPELPKGATWPTHSVARSVATSLFAELCESRAGSPPESRRQFWKATCLKWHPDKNPKDEDLATEVFQFLQMLKSWYLAA